MLEDCLWGLGQMLGNCFEWLCTLLWGLDYILGAPLAIALGVLGGFLQSAWGLHAQTWLHSRRTALVSVGASCAKSLGGLV